MSDLRQSPSEEIETFDEAAAGTSYESMLITTDSLEEFSQEISARLEDEATNAIARLKSNINEIQETIETVEINVTVTDQPSSSSQQAITSASKSSELLPEKAAKLAADISADEELGSQELLEQNPEYEDDGLNVGDYLHDQEWLNEREHVFVISSAGKPIYSLHGNEDKLATLCGVMQALVSVVHANQDTIMSIHAVGMKLVFLVKGPLILVAASRRPLSVQQIQLQLTYVLIFRAVSGIMHFDKLLIILFLVMSTIKYYQS